MPYGVTPYPVSPWAYIFDALTAGVQSYNQAWQNEQQRRMAEEQQAALRREEALRMQELERQRAAQALEMAQWAGTPQGYQILQTPAYQELFRQAGGVLPIESQQTVMPQGVPAPAPGSAPLSAVSAMQVQNQYRLPEKPQELSTLGEFYQRMGQPVPEGWSPNLTMLDAARLGWRYTPPDPKEQARAELQFILDVQGAPADKFLASDYGKKLVERAGLTIATDEAGKPYLPEIPWAEKPMASPPPGFEGITNREALAAGLIEPPEKPKPRLEQLTKDLYTPEALTKMDVPLALWDQPLSVAVKGSNALAMQEGLLTRKDLVEEAKAEYDQQIQSLKNSIDNASTPESARSLLADLGKRIAVIEAEYPELKGRYSMPDVAGILKRYQPQPSAGGERVLLVNGRPYTTSQAWDIIKQYQQAKQEYADLADATDAEKLADRSISSRLNKAIATLNTYDINLIRALQEGVGAPLEPLPPPPDMPSELAYTDPGPMDGKGDRRTPEQKQARTNAVRTYINELKAMVSAGQITQEQAIKTINKDRKWFNVAEWKWVSNSFPAPERKQSPPRKSNSKPSLNVANLPSTGISKYSVPTPFAAARK